MIEMPIVIFLYILIFDVFDDIGIVMVKYDKQCYSVTQTLFFITFFHCSNTYCGQN
jgi:hypothetical protein